MKYSLKEVRQPKEIYDILYRLTRNYRKKRIGLDKKALRQKKADTRAMEQKVILGSFIVDQRIDEKQNPKRNPIHIDIPGK